MADYWMLGGVGSATLSAIFYAVYRNRQNTIEALENVSRLHTADQLYRALSEAPDKKLPYAAVSGHAYCHDTANIKSRFVDDVKGLMQTVTTIEHKSEWSKPSNMWYDSERLISRVANSVPFKLFNGKEVTVTDPFEAQNLDFKVIYDKFDPIESNIGKSLVDWASGDKIKGYQFVEKMLLPGTYLTGVGEVSLSANGEEVKLSPPSNGLPYFLTQLSVDALAKQYKTGKKTWMVLSMIFGIGGGALLLIALYKYYKRRRERAENEALYRAMQEEGRIAGVLPGEEDNPGTVCIICMENPRNVVLLNCGHVCVCRSCANQVTSCPVCRADIVRMVPIYQS